MKPTLRADLVFTGRELSRRLVEEIPNLSEILVPAYWYGEYSDNWVTIVNRGEVEESAEKFDGVTGVRWIAPAFSVPEIGFLFQELLPEKKIAPDILKLAQDITGNSRNLFSPEFWGLMLLSELKNLKGK